MFSFTKISYFLRQNSPELNGHTSSQQDTHVEFYNFVNYPLNYRTFVSLPSKVYNSRNIHVQNEYLTRNIHLNKGQKVGMTENHTHEMEFRDGVQTIMIMFFCAMNNQ